MNYVGFALADKMFAGFYGRIDRHLLSVEKFKKLIDGGLARLFFNPQSWEDRAMIQAVSDLHDINLEGYSGPAPMALRGGDSVTIVSSRGLPKLLTPRSYTKEELGSAVLYFAQYTLVDSTPSAG